MGKRRDRDETETNKRTRQRRRERRVGAGDGGRGVRLRELIREEVNLLLRHEVGDPRLAGVEITMVELAGDCARLWYSCADGRDCGDACDGAAGFLRAHLAETLGLKRTPELRFRRDPAARVADADAAAASARAALRETGN
jgi:ribosome-binding factor A